VVDVTTTLELTDLQVLTLPDGGLKELDPWTIEKSIREEILRVEPHVVVAPLLRIGKDGFLRFSQSRQQRSSRSLRVRI
jgi:hypothetical protein